jgi:adenylosuccinate synthase
VKIDVVVGGQYGSEAKGHITQRVLSQAHYQRGRHAGNLVNVRVAGPNAGHTAYGRISDKWALRQVPVGAVSEFPVVLVIAPGSEIDPDVLLGEIIDLNDAGYLRGKSLIIDPNATIITDQHKQFESVTGLVNKIGSTGKGIGAARADRVMRRADRLADQPKLVEKLNSFSNVGVSAFYYQSSDRVVVEGTQGYGLGLHGLHYPQCTSSDCRAIDFLAMAGINPWDDSVRVHVVARMYPIRVAGNSGPMWRETSWKDLGLPEEKTTVTQKVRRVGHWDVGLVRAAVRANGDAPNVQLALTMLDQKWPRLAGVRTPGDLLEHPDGDAVYTFIKEVQASAGVKVSQITTGPQTGVWL